MSKSASATEPASAATAAIRSGAPWLVRLGRLGYVAKGMVYIVVGFLATEAAFGKGGRTTDSKGAIRTIGDGPFGKLALVVIIIGLFGYAAWRIVSAMSDSERRGDKAGSLALRAGEAFSGLAYASLAIWTLRFLRSNHASSGNQTRSMTDRVMAMHGGRWLVVLIGLGVIGYACYQVYRAVSGKFLKRLDLSAASAAMTTWVERLGKFGITARAVVFGMIGILLVRAGWTYNPSRVGGLEQSLDAIARQPKGGFIFGIVAIGLIAFGIFQIATAKFRVMRAT